MAEAPVSPPPEHAGKAPGNSDVSPAGPDDAFAAFVHLKVHSAYSLSEGAIKIDDLVALCRRYRMPAVAVTDSCNLFGALEFATTAAKAGVQPIIGCQLHLAREDEALRGTGRPLSPDRLVVLVQNEEGYLNLLRLASMAYLETRDDEPPQLRWEDVAAHAGGLIALTGGARGTVGRLLAEGRRDEAKEALTRLAAAFSGRLYVEIMRHGLALEERIEDEFIALAYDHDLPLVATNDVYFADPGMFEAHDALLCIAESRHMADDDRRRVTPEHWFKPAEEMVALFADLPEAVANTLVIARRCAYMPEPRSPILPVYPLADGKDPAAALRELAMAGLDKRLAAHVLTDAMDEAARKAAAEPYDRRLDYELEIINEMGFAGYFLIVSDFIRWAKGAGIPVGPGRGSGAGSVTAWALDITDLDPLRFGLLFERFLNPERISMPDFDIDFCQERRDEVIRYVQEKYGHDRVAQIITFGKLQARAALRDVGRVLQIPYGKVDGICKLVPNNPANPVSLQEAVDGEPLLQAARDEDEDVARMIDIALKIEGLYRHASTHAAGVVIGDRPLDALVPLYRDRHATMPATQFSMKQAETAGLVKFDFLGLKTLTVLARSVALLRQRGIEIDLSTLPLDDPATYEMLSKGDSVGVFQMESSGMRDVLRRLRPDRFEDLIAVVALFRPGPMDNIPRYIACKHGTETPDYLHPTLEGILKETFGIMIYQEQVMQIAQVLAGFSLGRADVLRRAMGKKIKSEMAAQRAAFLEGAEARGVDRRTATRIFDQVDKFAGYGFNKSHAAAYALVAYQTAYLKANYPVEFMAATMTQDMSNTDKLISFRQELERLEIPLLPPDVNCSAASFTVEPMEEARAEEGTRLAIRYALAAVRNVGQQAMEMLVAERQANGPFADLDDFASRIDPRVANKRLLENLIAAGAFDSLFSDRAQLFAHIDRLVRHVGAAATSRSSNQQNLFAEGGGGALPPLTFEPVEGWSVIERLQREHDAVGFYLSSHPLAAFETSLERLGVTSSAALPQRLAREGSVIRVTMAGVVHGRQERTSARGNRFAFVQLSDNGGAYEVTVFAELLGQRRPFLEGGCQVLLTVEAREEEGDIRLIAHGIEPLDKAVAGLGAIFRVTVKDSDALASLHGFMEQREKGRDKVNLLVPFNGSSMVEIALPGRYALSGAARLDLQALPGVAGVEEIHPQKS